MIDQRTTSLLRAAAVGLLALPAAALAQFGSPAGTLVAERLTGDVSGDVTPEPGDEIGVFFGEEIVGKFTFTSADPGPGFTILVFGDDPETEQVEGPEFNEVLTVRYFDGSTDTIRTDVAFANSGGETITLRFKGQEVPPGIDDILPIDLTPVRVLDLRVGVTPPGGGNGGGDGGGGTPGGSYDVNGDGDVDNRDAVVILRIVSGSISGRHLGGTSETASENLTSAQRAAARVRAIVVQRQIEALGVENVSSLLARADVNGDGVVNTTDAVEVLRNRE